jgi:hypothetical protein
VPVVPVFCADDSVDLITCSFNSPVSVITDEGHELATGSLRTSSDCSDRQRQSANPPQSRRGGLHCDNEVRSAPEGAE